MTAKTIAEHFQDGIDLFNAGRFFECHEAWEQAWLRSAGADKLFYQGMIQAAAAILHAQRGNFVGSRTLWTKAIGKLRPLPASYMGIALQELRQELERFFDSVLCGQSPLIPPPMIRRTG